MFQVRLPRGLTSLTVLALVFFCGGVWAQSDEDFGDQPLPAYEVCADGLTVADLNTGLLWELKVPGGGGSDTCLTDLHGVGSFCTWGQATSDWIGMVNLEGGTGYAGFSDWRVPSIKELQSIVDYSVPSPGPTIAASFPGETASSIYWAVPSDADSPGDAWGVGFKNGGRFGPNNISNNQHVRAVRSGPCSP